MGAAVGQGLAEKCFKSSRHETKVMIACGIAAGLSAAFFAPLAGALFLLEEITYTFESQTWLTALTAAIASDLVTLLFFWHTTMHVAARYLSSTTGYLSSLGFVWHLAGYSGLVLPILSD